MAKNQIQFIELTKDQRAECERLSRASASGWWRMSKEEMIPSFVPAGLHPKLDGGVFILSGSASGSTFLMYGAERIDYPDNAVDIQPFGAIVSPSGASPTMAVIHHGGWPERSIELPPDYVEVMSGRSAGNYFFARPPEGKISGSLDDLSDGQRFAFERIVKALSEKSSARGA